MSDSQREGLISLLLKQEPDGQFKDPVNLKNWRPITLQCYDAKILAKCIAHRLKSLPIRIIHQDQFRFLQGRFNRKNIRQMLTDLIENVSVFLKEAIKCWLNFQFHPL